MLKLERKKKLINIVLKCETCQFFRDNIFLQMTRLLWDGGSGQLFYQEPKCSG